MLDSIKRLVTSGVACTILASCSGISQVPPSQMSTSESHAVASSRTLVAKTLSLSPPLPFKGKSQICYPAGGTLAIPTIKNKKSVIVSGSVQYGPNTCTAKPKDRIEVESMEGGGQCPPLSGYTEAGFYVTFSIPHSGGPYSFSGSGFTGTVSSSSLNPSSQYTMVIGGDGYLQEEYVGSPVNGALTFTSPFQSGMNWPAGNNTISMVACSPS
jgi:hypothetical protein